MSNRQHTPFAFSLAFIGFLFFLTFTVAIFLNNSKTFSENIIDYAIFIAVIGPTAIYFMYLYRKMNKPIIRDDNKIRYYNQSGEVDLQTSKLRESLCPKCNFKNHKNDVYCGNCGWNLFKKINS